MGFRKTESSRGIGSKRDVVTLEDLAPRRDIRGGSARRVFGAETANINHRNEEDEMAASKTKKAKDLPPKKAGAVKGGGKRLNENLTLVRAAKPKVKKDLPPKSTAKVKGGGRLVNENLTLVRAAKPKVKKDLPPKKSPKGGLGGYKTR